MAKVDERIRNVQTQMDFERRSSELVMLTSWLLSVFLWVFLPKTKGSSRCISGGRKRV